MAASFPHPQGLIVPEIRWHDGYFSVCATLYRDIDGVRGRVLAAGQLDAEDYPEQFRKFLPYHLFDASGPMHYVANSLYLASDEDCWGHIGGKEPELARARKAACWPDAELCDFTEEKLLARLPALMKEFVTVCGEYLPQEVIDKWK